MQGNVEQSQGKFGPKCYASNLVKDTRHIWMGIGLAVRSNKGFTVSLLFRHSVVAVVAEADIFPPDLTQL